MSRPVPLRGVIEGFYGPPWSHAARIDVIDFLGERGMNAYVYAPKSDPLHRDRWREPYDDAELAHFATLARTCERAGARFGFALSPGIDISYADPADRDAVMAKLVPMIDAGVTWFVLALDDIANRPGLAEEQAELTGWLVEALRRRSPGLRCSLVPTEYVGIRPSPYLSTLSRALPEDVDVFWTGPTVCSPTIRAADAAGWRRALGGRPLLLWDNYPVNDAVMERELHLGPYRGREPACTDVLDGILCNPMLQPRASLVALATAADYLADPDAYDETASWERALDDVGSTEAPALRALARACCDGPLAPPASLPAATLVDELRAAVDGCAWTEPVAALRDELTALRVGCREWPADDPMHDEVRPWLDQACREADAGLAALRLVQQTHAIATTDDAGRAVLLAPDPESAMLQVFTVLFCWSAARDATPHVVLGPRFAMHPAVIQRADGTPAVDVDLALREDASVVDHLARVALARYARVFTDEDRAPGAPVDAALLPFRDGRVA